MRNRTDVMEQDEGKPVADGAAARTARQIETLILEGALSPGDPLLPERELAERLSVSRPTLRQALKLLESRGLILADQGRRLVAPLGRGLTDPLIALIADHGEVVDDYLEFRATAERMAAGLAARRANDVDRARIGEAMAAIDRAHEAGPEPAEAAADVALHLALYEASHNLVLMQVMRALTGLLRRGVMDNRETMFRRPETREALRAQHRAIHDAVLAGDAAAAETAAEAHIRYVHQALGEIAAAEARLATSLRRLDGGGIARRG
nr:FCD domain-containing protein [Tistrella mobilis]